MSARGEQALIETLNHNAMASGNQPLERRMADLTVWFYKNVHDIPRDNLAAKQMFLEKAMWCMIEVMALLMERQREDTGSSKLYLPRGIRANGQEFG